MEWTGDDAVVLTAIAIGGGRSLDRLLANIDVCNHDVPPFEVVGPALGRLSGAGVIEPRGSGFRLTRFGRTVVKGTRAATIARVGKIDARLASVPTGGQEAVLEREEWDDAVERYVHRHHG
jgi:hypothetical protein